MTNTIVEHTNATIQLRDIRDEMWRVRIKRLELDAIMKGLEAAEFQLVAKVDRLFSASQSMIPTMPCMPQRQPMASGNTVAPATPKPKRKSKKQSRTKPRGKRK